MKLKFRFAKPTHTETTWESLFFKDVDAGGDVENINKTVVTDWSTFKVCTEHDAEEVEVYIQQLWG